MISKRKTPTRESNEQILCEVCGQSNRDIKLERHEGYAIHICGSCRSFGMAVPPKKPTKKRGRRNAKNEANTN